MFYVYVIKSKIREEIYTGSTNDLKRRIEEHNSGKELSIKRYKPWKLIYYEAYSSEVDARNREKKLKYHGNAMKELKKRIQQSLTNGAGFTLIEILVVIALIGVLAGILIVSFQGVRKSARDSKRKADLEQIRAGLEMCRQQTRTYPVGTSYVTGCEAFIPSLFTDPLAGYQYVYSGTSISFTLCAYLEGGTETTNCSGACGANCITSPATACNYRTCNP